MNPDDMEEEIMRSYEFLKTEELQYLFLLCCLYPEDYDIPLDELTIYAKGLGLLKGITSLRRARNRVRSMVELLKSRFLLLDGISANHVKMHDVIRDVAIYIALEKKLIACDSGSNDCKWISPQTSKGINLDGGSRVFSNLHFLWIENEELKMDDEDFFEGMKELNVFSIKWSSLQQLPRSMGYLENLQTFILDSCKSLKSLSGIGELVNLESFICRNCWLIESIPVKEKLRRLMLLEFSDCENLKTIGAGIISNLERLEELIVKGCFDEWELEKERTNAALSELEQLPSLSRLKIEIKDCRLASRDILLSANMVGYHIRIGKVPWYSKKRMVYEKKMELALPANIRLGKWVNEFVGSAEMLYFEGDCSSVDFGVAQSVKVLVIKGCSTVKKLVSAETTPTIFPVLEYLELSELSELKEICDNTVDEPITTNSLITCKELKLESLPALEHLNVVSIFNKLSSVCVDKCGRLRSLFSSTSTMTGDSSLVHLERFEISDCAMMEHVLVWDDDEEEKMKLVFGNLKFLKLENLPKLTSFSKGIEAIEFPVLEEMIVRRCPLASFVSNTCSDDVVQLLCQHNKMKFDCLRRLELHCEKEDGRRIWCSRITLALYSGLRCLKIHGLYNLKSLFSLTTASGSVRQLEKLEIGDCDMMESVIRPMEEEEEDDDDEIQPEENKNEEIAVFPKLKVLSLHNLPRLRRISAVENIHFLLPVEMKIFNCPLLEACGSSTADDDSIHLLCRAEKGVDLGSLEKLEIGGYEEVRKEWCPQIQMIEIFGGLSELTISNIRGVKSLFSSSVARSLHRMRYLCIWRCKEMIRVIEDGGESSSAPMPMDLLPNLESLRLYYLPKLKCFCECRCPVQFGMLTSMDIFDCDMMEEFSRGPLTAPLLHRISGNRVFGGEEDVNAALARPALNRQEYTQPTWT